MLENKKKKKKPKIIDSGAIDRVIYFLFIRNSKNI